MKPMHNVASGPAVYPQVVLERISSGILNVEGNNISTLEIGHRTDLFLAIRDELISLTKEILKVPDDYFIMYLQGGGRLHFAQIPMNFLSKDEKVQIIDTGYWSTKAAEYAGHYGTVETLVSSRNEHYASIPNFDFGILDGKYLQYCSNNTIYGTQFHSLPASNIPAVVDMSSDIFSKSIDFEKVDLVMACAQKNFGPAGVSLLIIKDDFLTQAKDDLPAIFSYKNLASKNSNYNTPPIFQLCASLEMLGWIKEKGGLLQLEKEVNGRAQKLYDAIDSSGHVTNMITKAHRSNTNIIFDANDKELENTLKQKFAAESIHGINGHKARGGFRVGNYLGQTDAAIDAVIACL